MNDKLKKSCNICLSWIKSNVWILLVFVVAFLFRFLLIQANPCIQVDEPATFYVSTPTVVSNDNDFFKIDWSNFNIKKQKDYSGLKVNNLLFKPDASFESMIKDIKQIRQQALDRQHPSLYYCVVRIWNNNLGDFDKDKYLIHARMLNLLFFSFSFFFMFKLLSLIKDDKSFIALALVFCFLNIGSISLAALAREYALQETFFILVAYLALFLYKKIDSLERISVKTTLLTSLSFALFLTAGYFSVVFLILILVLLFIKAATKKTKMIISLALIVLISVLFTLIICPNYLDFKTSNEHFNSVIASLSFSGIINSEVLECFLKYLLKNLFYPFILYFIALIFLLYSINIINLESFLTKKEKKQICCLVIIVGFWILGVLFLTPYKCLRFFAAGLPIFSMIILLMVSGFRPYLRVILAITFILFTLRSYTTGQWYDTYDRTTTYQEDTLKSLPSVVVNPTYFFFNYTFLNLNKDTNIRFEDESNLKNLQIKGLYKLICNNNTTKPKAKGLSSPKKIWDMQMYLILNSNN